MYIQDGYTALHLVCMLQHFHNQHFDGLHEWCGRIKSFIEAGADTEVQDSSGRIAFSYLRTMERIERANLLVKENKTLRACVPILK